VVRQVGEAVLVRGLQLDAVVGVVGGQSLLPSAQPEVLESGRPVVAAAGPEGMDVAVAPCLPALERDAQLDRALRGGEVFLLAYPEQAVEGAQRRDRGLAHADRADLLRLDQG